MKKPKKQGAPRNYVTLALIKRSGTGGGSHANKKLKTRQQQNRELKKIIKEG